MKKNDAVLQEHEKWWSSLATDAQRSAFQAGIGPIDAASRRATAAYIRESGYESVLDCGSGTGLFHECLKQMEVDIQYVGVDITPVFVEDTRKRGMDISLGSVESLPFPANSFDLCYARHLLEHLSYYTKALQEMVRVARREAMHTFFIPPGSSRDEIRLTEETLGVKSKCHYNYYCRADIERFVLELERVERCFWEQVENKSGVPESTLHVIKTRPRD